ncbi:hypothetical protein KY358_00935 [Candidatus Woesearchaeota archaeon]|nr:hypothetical protein [Candidatus Woesearchaeota archaeon]
MGKLLKIMSSLLCLYFTYFIIESIGVAKDYLNVHKKWLEENIKNELVIKDFSTTIDEKVKDLTFVGEYFPHYNSKESDFAGRVVKNFDLVLNNKYKEKEKSISNHVAEWTIYVPVEISKVYINLAEGRSAKNPQFKDFARDYGIPVRWLEKCNYDDLTNLSYSQVAKITTMSLILGTIGPYLYWTHKKIVCNEDSKEEFKNVNSEDFINNILGIDEQKTKLSKQLLSYLNHEKASKILVVVEKDDLEDILSYLSSEIRLKPKEIWSNSMLQHPLKPQHPLP